MADDLNTLREEMNRRFDAVAELISQFAQRVDTRFESLEKAMDTRFQLVDQRLDRIDTRLTAIELQTAGMNRSLDQF